MSIECGNVHLQSARNHAGELYKLARLVFRGEPALDEARRLLSLIAPPRPPAKQAAYDAEWKRVRKIRKQERWRLSPNFIYADLLYIVCQIIEDYGDSVPADVIACDPRFYDAIVFLNQNLIGRRASFTQHCYRLVKRAEGNGMLKRVMNGKYVKVDMTEAGWDYLATRRKEEAESEYV